MDFCYGSWARLGSSSGGEIPGVMLNLDMQGVYIASAKVPTLGLSKGVLGVQFLH